MTVIVGHIDKKIVYIGGDSAAVDGTDVVMRKDSKVFKKGPFLIGCAGSFRSMQIIRFQFFPSKQKKNQETFEYMCTDFVDKLREVLKAAGALSIKDEIHENDGSILVGYRSRLFYIDEDFHVGEHIEPWNAIGLGAPYSLGAFKALNKVQIPIKDKIKLSLEAAANYCGGVQPPFNIDSI